MKLSLTNFFGCGHRVLVALVLSGATAAASEITFDIGANTGVKKSVSAPFDVLNGTSLQGQTLSINFVFGSGRFGRLFTVSNSSLIAGLSLNTNSGGFPPDLDGTGYLFDQQGQQMIPLQTPQQLGIASSDNGVMFAGLSPLLDAGLNRPLDFFGIHFDLTLPDNPSVAITPGSLFDIAFVDNNPSARFGIGPGIPIDIVPEGTATLFLFSIGVAAVVFGRIRLAKAS